MRTTQARPSICKTLLSLLFLTLIFTGCEKDEEPRVNPIDKGYFLVTDSNLSISTSVFAIVKINLEHALLQTITIDGEKFRPVVVDFQLSEGSTLIEGETQEPASDETFTFYPKELLKENTTYAVKASFGWQIFVNDAWEPVNDKTEVFEKEFTTSTYSTPVDLGVTFAPGSAAVDQSPFVNPSISLQSGFEAPVTVGDQTFRAVYVNARITQNGSEVPALVAVGDGKNEVIISPESRLLSMTEYAIALDYGWERNVNNEWKALNTGGVMKIETLSGTFTTRDDGVSPGAIHPDNINYAYPIPNQYHFLKQEHGTGFVMLNNTKDNNLFNEGYGFLARFTSPGKTTLEATLTVDLDALKISYQVPGALENETIYKLEFIKRPTGTVVDEEAIYAIHFRTSKFNTFSEKMAAVTFKPKALTLLRKNNLFCILNDFTPVESFDDFERETTDVTTNERSVPVATNLVRFEAIVEGNDWYEDEIYSLLYEPWTDADFYPTIQRETSVVGKLPVNALSFAALGDDVARLTPEAVDANNAPPISFPSNTRIVYDLPVFFKADLNDIRSKVADRYLNDTNVKDREHRVIWAVFPQIKLGTYEVWIKYVIPGETETSKVKVTLNYDEF